MTSTGRSYTEFLKSFFTSSTATTTTSASPNTAAGMASSSTSAVPTEKLTELDVKGIKGNSYSKTN